MLNIESIKKYFVKFLLLLPLMQHLAENFSPSHKHSHEDASAWYCLVFTLRSSSSQWSNGFSLAFILVLSGRQFLYKNERIRHKSLQRPAKWWPCGKNEKLIKNIWCPLTDFLGHRWFRRSACKHSISSRGASSRHCSSRLFACARLREEHDKEHRRVSGESQRWLDGRLRR